MKRLTLGFILGLGVTLGADALVDLHPDKLIVGTDRAWPPTGTNLEVHGPGNDGGMAVVAHGTNPRDETFYMSAQQNGAGVYRKSMSISTVNADPDPTVGYYVTRYNTTYSDTGLQRDDLAMQVFGGHGVAFFAPDSTPQSAPGKGVLKVHGDVQIHDINVAQAIAELQKRVAVLEAGGLTTTCATPGSCKPKAPAAPTSDTIACPSDPHPACRVLPSGSYNRQWANTVARE